VQLFRNLQALTIDTDGLITLLNLDDYSLDLFRPDRSLPKADSQAEKRRLTCIETLLDHGYFEAAVILLSDLAKVDDTVIEKFAIPFAEQRLNFRQVPLPVNVNDDANRLTRFKAMVCYNLCCKNVDLAQAGRMVLRDILNVDANSSELQPYQRHVFDMIAASVQFLSMEVRTEFLQKLFNLPDIDPADLFRKSEGAIPAAGCGWIGGGRVS